MKMSKAERQLIALEKDIRNFNKKLSKLISDLSPKCRRGIRDLVRETSLKVKPSEITIDDVFEALGSFAVKQGDSGWHFYPPSSKIHPTTWNRIKKVMADNGGTWVTQRQAFWFEDDPSHIFSDLAKGKLANKKKDRQAFYTPAAYAAKVAALADVRGQIVMEPSAGDGALVKACIDAGAYSVSCYEIDPAACAIIRDNYPGRAVSVSEMDFLETETITRFPRIVMNPPFAKDAYIKHIQHALRRLAPGGRLVSIIPGNLPMAKFAKLSTSLPKWSTWDCIPMEAGAFSESGTNIKTSILVINLDQNK